MSQELVDELTRGSEITDRLKHEVEMILGMIISQVKEKDWERPGDEDTEEYRFPCLHGVWRVVPLWGHNPKHEFGYHLQVEFLLGPDEEQVYIRRHGRSFTDGKHYVAIHSSRAEFAAGMIKTIPALLDRLKPIREAAAYQ